MASRLSSLLVRDGLVSVHRMEKAFHRQVIGGGSLDTILLEMGLLSEERLTQYLALAVGVPPATADEFAPPTAEAVALVPRTLAEQTRVVPLAVVAEGLRVLVRDPIDMPLLELLADTLDLGVQPVVAPEFRYLIAFAAAYGESAPPRAAMLARRLAEAVISQPVGRAQSVIVDAIVSSVAAADQPTAGVPMLPVPPAPTVPVELPRVATPSTIEALRRAAEWRDEPMTDPDARSMTLTAAEVRARLASATDAEQVFAALLDGVRARFVWAGIFTIQAGIATGRQAIADAGFDANVITALALPTELVPGMVQAIATRRAQLVPLASGDDGINGQLSRLGSNLSKPSLMMPIVLGTRVVAMLVGHRGKDPVSMVDIAELLPLADAAAEALTVIIARQKAAATPPEARAARMLDDLETGDAEAVTKAIADADALLPHALARFPGRLLTTRYQLVGRPLRGSQHGPLLAYLVALGQRSLPLLVEKMANDDRDQRYYATACVAELGGEPALAALIERVFDKDFATRQLAVEALAASPRAQLDDKLPLLRRRLVEPSVELANAAADALATLVDVEAMLDFLAALDLRDARGESVRRALSTLTRQDFGTNGRRWRGWYNEHRSQHRIEWLIDALGHRDEPQRQGAIGELRRLTGESFGYEAQLARRELATAIGRWRTWWANVGRLQFG